MNEKMNSNSMWNMNKKSNSSVLIQGFWYSTKRNETMNDFPDFGDPCFAHRILGPLYLERLQKSLQELFSCPQPEHSVGLRFQTIPVSLKTSNFPGDCRLPDKGFAYGIHWYLLISLVRIFLDLSDFFVNKFCVFFHMGTIFFKRLLVFFNSHDVDLCIGYFSLKSLHCLVKAEPPLPNFGQLSFLGQQERNWAKPVFKDVSMVI